jgi:signal transduction histidine kinase/ligand-binding sensor domain-containing protein
MKTLALLVHHLAPAAAVPALRLLVAAACLVLTRTECRAHPRFLIDVWTPYDGLPQSRVTGITQTPEGYLWIATHLGWLVRFDGVRFQHFNPENTPALVSPEIHKLLVDDRGGLFVSDIDGRLITNGSGVFKSLIEPKPGYDKRVVELIGRRDGEALFLTASGGLLRLGREPHYEDGNRPAISHPLAVRQVCQDADGTLWCRTNSGQLGIWSDAKPDLLPATESVQSAGVNHLLALPGGGLLLATDAGLWQHGSDGFSRIDLTLPDAHRRIIRIARCGDGSLWLLTGGGLLLVRGSGIVHATELPQLDLSSKIRPPELHADSAGAAWLINTDQGVIHVAANGSLSALHSRNGLPGDQVETWFEDREKNIWLGTVAGLVRLRPRWFHVVETAASGPGSAVVSISQDRGGAIWLGCAKGLTRWHEGRAENIPLPRTRPNIPMADVTIAPGDAPAEVWLGTVESGAMLLKNGGVEHPFPFDAPGLAIRTIRRDPAGGIWLGGEFGLFRWQGGQLRKFGPEDGLQPGHIHDICFDSDGTPWIAKADDILVAYRKGRFETIPLPGISTQLRIHTLLCGSDGSVYIGTVGGGLLHVTRGRVFRYTTDDGLPGNSVPQLLEDHHGFLWGGTHRGIFRVSTTALDMRSKGVAPPFLFHTYGHSDGLPEAECSGGLQPACWKDSNRHLWFSTMAGAVTVNPDDVAKNLHAPTALIEEFRINDHSVNTLRRPVTVEPGRHRYEFRFTALSTTAPLKAGFQWRLGGVDPQWIDGGDQRSVAYAGLDPGDYQLQVRARNNDGVWSVKPATLSFRVLPSFWQNSWVRAFATLALAAVGFLAVTGFMRHRHQREIRALEYANGLEQQRYRHKQAMAAERARIAAELHDDLGANLTQIQWLADPGQPSESQATAEQLLPRIRGKCRETVRLIDEIVWSVNPKNDTLDQLASYVCNFAGQFFSDSPTRARIDVHGELPQHVLKADVRHHLFLIAKEAFHNVAKHAATDRVWVRIASDNGWFRLVIEDRGRGFDPGLESAGDGLANMRRRAILAGANLLIDSSPAAGTRVTIELPLEPHKP